MNNLNKQKGIEVSYEELLLKILKRGGNSFMKEDENRENKLTHLEIDNIIDETINLSILTKLLKLELINEKQFYFIKNKNKKFWLNTTDL